MGAMRFSVIIFCAVLCVCSGQLRREAYATVPQLIASSGYPVEKHRVTTEDGYILQIFRIPAGRRSARRSGPSAKGKRAVMMVHGLLGNSGNFVIMGPQNSLGYILADAGYDVWLANLRGNFYTAHKNLTRNDPAFWEFSFHEHGKYDAPAIIDKILTITGLSKVFYIGHSMGTTTFFTMLSQRPEYNDKLVAFVAMAPAVYMSNMKAFVNFFLKSFDLLNVMRRRGYHALSIRPEVLAMFVGSFCTARQPQTDICMRFLYAIVGEDYDLNPWDMVPVLLSSMHPASFRQVEHFAKVAMTGNQKLYNRCKSH
ncbi:lipase 1-like [Ostrinia nubilalis]|uniref:lipase 1-like n=1 Tax=Ostrinia nubilalis TaxID=29057 RepID=UPI0030826101